MKQTRRFGLSGGGERGSVTIMIATLMLGLVLCLGLAIDMARIYMIRAELQNAADAAALAGARELNSGSDGIHDAVTEAGNIVNNYGFNRTGVTTTKATITTVEFSTSLNGTYVNETTAANSPTNIRFVRVTTQSVNVSVIFAASALTTTHAEQRTATAGMSPGLNTICDYVPLAVAAPSPITNPPFPINTELTLQHKDSTNTTLTLAARDFVVIDSPEITGTGANETRDATAGSRPVCTTIGSSLTVENSSSSNTQNGPYQVEDGINTRMDVYPQGNVLDPDEAPPDSNVYENPQFSNFNWTHYKAGSPSQLPKMADRPYARDNRRVIVMPIVEAKTYTTGQVEVKGFGAFLLLRSVSNPKQPSKCNDIPNPCGHVVVQYINDSFAVGRGFYDPTGGATSLTKAVLYK